MEDWVEPAGGPAGGEESLSGPAADDHLWVLSGETAWDLGPALLDSDCDGVADSLTVSEDGLVTVYTDTDADGCVDRITELDSTGDCAVNHLDPGTGRWQPTRFGRLE